MSISFSALRESKNLTLPSVQGWGGNLNIMKDPPKGIFTKKKIRVGDDNTILDQQKASGDRVAENVMVYARGVNPFVEVDMGNNGTQGGRLTAISKVQPKLPHRIGDGAFRPSVDMFMQYNTHPLSRLPRRAVHVTTNPESIRYAKLVNPDNVKAASNPKLLIEGFQVEKKFLPQDGYSNHNYLLEKNVPNHSMKTNVRGIDRNGDTQYRKEHARNLPSRSFMINRGDRRIDLTNQQMIRDYTRLRENTPFGKSQIDNRGVNPTGIFRELPHSVTTSVKESDLRNRSSSIYNSYLFRK